MPKHINSAYRMYYFLSAACDKNGNEQIWKVFVDVLGISGSNNRKRIFEVNRKLDLFFDEVERAHQQLKDSNFSPDLYEDVFTVISQYIDASLIYNTWEGNRNVIKGILPTLKFCSEVLPHEEELITEEDFAAIKQSLNQLDTALHESNLPEYAKAFIYQQISIIKKALSDYQIIGAKAFKLAIYEGYVNYLDNEDVVKENAETKEISLLRKTWDGIKKVADYTVKSEKVISAGAKLYELGTKISEHL